VQHLFILLVFISLVLSPAAGSAELPPENRCPTLTAASEPGAPADAGAILVKEGMLLSVSDLLKLKSLFPKELWAHRDIFFFEGMQMQVGPCHRRYVAPGFFTNATQENRGTASLDKYGNLKGYLAGTPFPLEEIDSEASDAAVRWAWNFESRYRGAGPVGKFRLTDVSRRDKKPLVFLGEFFQVFTAHRADLVEQNYQVEDAGRRLWVAGGRFDEPFDARHLAWRQVRNEKSQAKAREPDDLFVYIPTMRKPRRAATSWVDGIFMPTYHASGDSGGGGVMYSQGGQYGTGGGTAAPTAAKSIAASENLRRGFVGLTIHPNAYDWEFIGEREVLAPLNVVRQGYPENPDRNFGPYGLSYASDRWDVRYATVITGKAKRKGGPFEYVTLYIDYQTLQPLYYFTRRGNKLPLDIGILVHRYSGDNAAYPQWPGGTPALVFDSVGSTFFTVGTGGGWRRESYGMTSVPQSENQMRRMTSINALGQGH